jgi:hypothetical protein
MNGLRRNNAELSDFVGDLIVFTTHNNHNRKHHTKKLRPAKAGLALLLTPMRTMLLNSFVHWGKGWVNSELVFVIMVKTFLNVYFKNVDKALHSLLCFLCRRIQHT